MRWKKRGKQVGVTIEALNRSHSWQSPDVNIKVMLIIPLMEVVKYLSKAPWAPSPKNVVNKMLHIAQVGQDDVVYDLGSGDGRMLFAAVEEFNAKRAIGYELQEHLYQFALEKITKRNLTDRIKIYKQDMFEADLSEASVVALYLSAEANELLRPKLEKELRNGVRVVSLVSRINNWETSWLGWGEPPPKLVNPPVPGWNFLYYPIYLYVIPDAFDTGGAA